MTNTITLSLSTKNAIQAAEQQGYQDTQLNSDAYTAIYNDLTHAGGFNSGTVSWFQQAGSINTENTNPNPAGAYIWGYTEAAAAEQGINVTNTDMQIASNDIAGQVFDSIIANNYSFTDIYSPTQTNFSMKSIVQDDAGVGISVLGILTGETLSNADWGGTLFATTELGDPTYFSDQSINLTPGSQDALDILAGAVGGAESATTELSNTFATNPLLGVEQLSQALVAFAQLE